MRERGAGQREIAGVIRRRSDRVVNFDRTVRHGKRGSQRIKHHGAPTHTIHARTQDHVAVGHRELCRLHVDIATGIGGEIAPGGRHGRERMGSILHDIDIAQGRGAETSIGRSDGCVQRDIAPGHGDDVAPGCRNGFVHDHIPHSHQTQCGRRRGCRRLGPGDGCVHRDVAAAQATGVGGIDDDIGPGRERGHDVGHGHGGRGGCRIRGKDAADQRAIRGGRGNRHIGRVQQPQATPASGGARLDVDASHIQPVAGSLNQTTVTPLHSTACADGSIGARAVVGPENDLAAVAAAQGIGVDAGVSAHVGGGGVWHRRVLPLVVAAHQHRAAASVTGRLDLCAKEAHVVPGQGHPAAGLPLALAGGIQRAAHAHCAALHVAQQPDGALVVLDAARLDHAGVVHRALRQAARGLRRHQHQPAVGLDQPAVVGQCIDRALLHRDTEQPVTGQVQRDRTAGGQCDRAQPGRDHALVADTVAQQRHLAARGGGDAPFVDHRATALTGKPPGARHDITVGDVQGGGDQAAYIDRSPLAKQDAVGIDHKHPPVGRQAAQDGRGVRAQHPVQHHGAAVGLHKQHPLAQADVEALPVDGRVLRGLGDGGAQRAGGHAGRARSHHAALRQCRHLRSESDGQGNGQRLHGKARRAACRSAGRRRLLASGVRRLRRGHKSAGGVIPD